MGHVGTLSEIRGKGVGKRAKILILAPAPSPELPASINAPTLTLSSVTEYPPPLEAAFDETVLENDVLRVQSSATVDFASPIINDTSTLDASAILSGEIPVTGLSSIESPAQTYFRARVERGANSSAWSTIVKHGDTVAPTITSSASPSVDELTASPTGTLTANEDIALWEISGGADAALFSLEGAEWTLNVTPDYETKSSYVVEFRAIDYGGNSSTQTMTLAINDVDDAPSAFTFTDVSDADLSTVYTSNTITVAGLGTGVAAVVTISGGTYSKNGGAYASTATTAVNGDTFAVRGTSPAADDLSTNVVLTIGTVSDTYTISTPSSINADATALFARMSVEPDFTRKQLYSDLYDALSAAGVLAKLDALYVMCAHDAQAARLNLIAGGADLTTVNTPLFTTDRGYRASQLPGPLNGYLTAAINVTTGSPKYVRNSAHVGVWERLDYASDFQFDLNFAGGSQMNTGRATGDTLRGRVTGGSNANYGAIGTSIGHFLLNRVDSANVQGYHNGATAGTAQAVTSTAPTSEALLLLTDGANHAFDRQMAFAHVGSGLTGTEIGDLYDALAAFATGVGA